MRPGFAGKARLNELGSENLNRLKLVLVSTSMLRARSAAPAIHVPPILALSTALLKLARDTCYRSADSEVWLRVRELLACDRLRPVQAVWRQLSSASDKKVEDLLKLIVCPMTKTPLTFDRDRCCCKLLFLFAGSCTAALRLERNQSLAMGTGCCSVCVCHAPVHADTLAGAHTHVPADTKWRVYTTGKSSSRRLRDWHSRWSMAFPT